MHGHPEEAGMTMPPRAGLETRPSRAVHKAMARRTKPFNLFVYGTLMDPSVFRAVLGRRLVPQAGDADGIETFHARDAVLQGYKKVSPDNTYLYAIPDGSGRIHGYIVGPLPGESIGDLLRYEGKNYLRKTVRVQTAAGAEKAVAFVGNVPELRHSFGYAFHDPLKQEILLREKIDAALREAQREQLHTEKTAGRRAVGELLGSTIRDLVRRHFEAGGISDYAIKHSIQDAPLRDFGDLVQDREARALAPHYLSMVVRQVIFNQIEEKVWQDFRFELDQLNPEGQFYERAVSSLTALRMVNRHSQLVSGLGSMAMADLSFERNHLVEFVEWGVTAADALYDPRAARQQIQFIRRHMASGDIPLGTELEFSNIGHGVIRDGEGNRSRDSVYDGFYYFQDFALDVLTWKLGGHVDDHRERASAQRRRGFFEIALGSLSIEADISKPITDDPWTLNQFIHEARQFYHVGPHSVHISLQLRRQQRPNLDRLMPLSAMKCLFALAGDPGRQDGRVRIRRLASDEIVAADGTPHLLFSDISKRHSTEADEGGGPRALSGLYVQQFRFPRLSPKINYELLVLALKGLQLDLRQGTFLTAEQYNRSPRHRRQFDTLVEWGRQPTPLREQEMQCFLEHVKRGLMGEHRGEPAHSEAYIAWALAELHRSLLAFNHLVAR